MTEHDILQRSNRGRRFAAIVLLFFLLNICCIAEDEATFVLPMGLKVIGEEAFDGCSAAVHIIVPDSVETIGDRAFENCECLTSVEIPATVTNIGEEIFGENNDVIVYCPYGSDIYEYCRANGIDNTDPERVGRYFDICFEDADGNTIYQISAVYGDYVSCPVAPIKAQNHESYEYTFVGWYVNEDTDNVCSSVHVLTDTTAVPAFQSGDYTYASIVSRGREYRILIPSKWVGTPYSDSGLSRTGTQYAFDGATVTLMTQGKEIARSSYTIATYWNNYFSSNYSTRGTDTLTASGVRISYRYGTNYNASAQTYEKLIAVLANGGSASGLGYAYLVRGENMTAEQVKFFDWMVQTICTV